MTELMHDEKAAAILLRNPSNFDALVDAFEASAENDLRGKLDDALRALALKSTPPSSAPVQKEQTTAEVIERAVKVAKAVHIPYGLPGPETIVRALATAGLLRSSLAVPEGWRKALEYARKRIQSQYTDHNFSVSNPPTYDQYFKFVEGVIDDLDIAESMLTASPSPSEGEK